MQTITDLKVAVKDKNRVNLYLNNKFYCSLDLETVVKNGLKAGIIIDEKKLENIQLQSEKQTALNKVLRLINTRYKTQKEVQDYLHQKGYLPQVIYYVLEKLNEYHYIDDERYVDSYIASHKNFGKLKLKQELYQKGISQTIIDAKLEVEDFDQTEQICTLAQKYMKNKDDTKENYIKLFKYLMGKGFEYETIKSALNKEVE